MHPGDPEAEEADDSVAYYVNGIIACYTDLCQSSSVEPSLFINKTFEKLVSLCTRVPDTAIIAKVRCPFVEGMHADRRS